MAKKQAPQLEAVEQVDLNIPGTLCGRFYCAYLKGGELALKEIFGKTLNLKSKPFEYRRAVMVTLQILKQENMLLERTDRLTVKKSRNVSPETLNERLTEAFHHGGEKALKKNLGGILRSRSHPLQYRDALIVVVSILSEHQLLPTLIENTPAAEQEPARKPQKISVGVLQIPTRLRRSPLGRGNFLGMSKELHHGKGRKSPSKWEGVFRPKPESEIRRDGGPDEPTAA